VVEGLDADGLKQPIQSHPYHVGDAPNKALEVSCCDGRSSAHEEKGRRG
jgi:hypothetical protein